MKKPETYVRCEQCDALMLKESPAPKEQYAKGRIEIRGGIVLLSPAIVKANKKKGVADGHAASFDGYYCDRHCLNAKLDSILWPKK